MYRSLFESCDLTIHLPTGWHNFLKIFQVISKIKDRIKDLKNIQRLSKEFFQESLHRDFKKWSSPKIVKR